MSSPSDQAVGEMSMDAMPEFFDTHAHLDDETLLPQVEQLMDRCRAAGVRQVVTVGTTLSSSRLNVELAGRYHGLFAAVGIQPNCVAEMEASDWDGICRLCGHPAVRALGETGLDRYWDTTPLSLQQDLFDRHLRQSQETGLPFIVHMRDSEREVLAMLEEAAARGPLRGVMHSFTGDAALASACVGLGLHISFAGMVTFKKSDALREVAASIPVDRILIETDAPYLSPHPCRGQRPNEPARVVHTAACLAEVRNQSLDRFARQTTANARQLFGVPPVTS